MAGGKLIKGVSQFALKKGRDLLTYRPDWRNERTGYFDPDYFDIEEDELLDDAGNAIARKDKLITRPHLQSDIPETAQEGLMWRGMSAPEYGNIQRSGQILSRGEYNLGDLQKGMTLFGQRPSTAQFYAGDFAPPQYKPTFSKPGFVVGAKVPPEEFIKRNPAFDPGEYNVRTATPAEDIEKVYRGDVVAYEPPFEKPGWKQGPRFRLNWQAMDFIKKYGVAGAFSAGLISQDEAEAAQQQDDIGKGDRIGHPSKDEVMQERLALARQTAQSADRRATGATGPAPERTDDALTPWSATKSILSGARNAGEEFVGDAARATPIGGAMLMAADYLRPNQRLMPNTEDVRAFTDRYAPQGVQDVTRFESRNPIEQAWKWLAEQGLF